MRLARQPRAGRRPRQGRVPTQAYPERLEDRYAADLEAWTGKVRRRVEAEILPTIERYGQERQDATARAGPPNAEVRRGIAGLRVTTERLVSADDWRTKVLRTAEQVERFNRHQVGEQVKAVAGFDVIDREGYDQETVSAFLEENIQLIKSIPDQYLDQVQDRVLEGFRAGRRAESIAKDLMERGDVAESRARLIARDQVGKLNGVLTQRRHEDLGVRFYIWRDSSDGRVRDSHRELDGRRFAYEGEPSPPAHIGHPGQDYQCRCRAEPDLQDALERLTGEDFGELAPKARAAAPRRVRAPRPVRELATPEKPPAERRVRLPRSGRTIELTERQAEARQRAQWLRDNPRARETASYEERRDWLQWEWVHGSNRKTSVMLKEAAIQEFNLRGVRFSRGIEFNLAGSDVRRARGDLRRMYEQTQRELRAKGVKTIRLYRGLKAEVTSPGAVSSWTADRKVAEAFDGHKVISIDVPVEKVLSGHGVEGWVDGAWGKQYEWLVME